jgi:hypothetical protein
MMPFRAAADAVGFELACEKAETRLSKHFLEHH